MSKVKDSSIADSLLKQIEEALFTKKSVEAPQTMLDEAEVESAFARLGQGFDREALSSEQSLKLAGLLMAMARRDVATGFTETGIDKALRRLEAANLIHQHLFRKEPDSFEAFRRVGMSLVSMADLTESRGLPGDHEKSFALHQQSVKLREDFLKEYPESLEVARDTVFGLNKLADFFFRRRQAEAIDQALLCYQRDLQICEDIYKRRPDLHGAARDVAFSASKLADFYSRRGEPGDEARSIQNFRRARDVCEESFNRYPDSLLSARDLSLAQYKLATALQKVGDEEDRQEALSLLARMLELRESIYNQKPQHPRAVADLVMALRVVGNALLQRAAQGDEERALKFFTRALDLQERLLAANPNSVEAARDVAVSLERVADLTIKLRGESVLDEVIAHHERGLAIRQRIARVDANTLRAASEFSLSVIKLASGLKMRGRPEDMGRLLPLHELNDKVNEQLHKSHPDSARVLRNRIVAVELLASCLEQSLETDQQERARDLRSLSATLRGQLADLLEEDPQGAARIGLSLQNLSAQSFDSSSMIEELSEQMERLDRKLEENASNLEWLRQQSATLTGLAEALEKRSDATDLQVALQHRRRSVELRAVVAGSCPDDFDDVNEHLVALEALARAVGRQGHDAAQAEAFMLQKSALDISLKLAEGDPDSVERRRMMMVSLYLTHECALAAGDGEQADHYLDLCHELMRDSANRGMEFDEDLADLYARLEAGEY